LHRLFLTSSQLLFPRISAYLSYCHSRLTPNVSFERGLS
jgi:hypothetical protein